MRSSLRPLAMHARREQRRNGRGAGGGKATCGRLEGSWRDGNGLEGRKEGTPCSQYLEDGFYSENPVLLKSLRENELITYCKA